MNHKHLVVSMLAGLLWVCTLGACSSDDNTIVYSDYCAVTNVTLGQLTRVVHTTGSKGQDSTYNVTIGGSYYPMYIDQVRGLIYNGDSLPYGTDNAHTVFASFACEGILAFRTASGEDSAVSIKTTSSSQPDSLDFSRPRTIVVYAASGAGKKVYTMSVNVHQQDGNAFQWHRMGAEPQLAALDSTHALMANGACYVFGVSDTTVRCLRSTDGASWTGADVSGIAGLRPRSVRRFDNNFYALDATGRLVRSTDGVQWADAGADTPLQQLLDTAGSRFYAIAQNHYVSSTDGVAWSRDEADTDGALPTTNVAAATLPSRTYDHFEILTAVGTSADSTVAWMKNIDTGGQNTYEWVYLNRTDENRKTLPLWASLQCVPYDQHIVAVGLEGGALKTLASGDYGRTWTTNKLYPLPAEAAATGSVALAVTDDHFIWLLCGGTGQVWRGRLNRLGWADNQTAFDRSIR